MKLKTFTRKEYKKDFNSVNKRHGLKKTEKIREKRIFDILKKPKIRRELEIARIKKQLLEAYGNFDIKTLESAKEYFNMYGEKFVQHRHQIKLEDSATELELQCKHVIEELNQAIYQEQTSGFIKPTLKNRIIQEHAEFVYWLKGYKKVI